MSVHKYSKISRIAVDSFVKRGKRYLSDQEVAALFSGSVVVEEKLDGKLVEIEEEGYTIYKEDLKRRHTVEYAALPAWEIGLDVWDPDCGFLDQLQKHLVFTTLGVPTAPVLFMGKVTSHKELLSFLGTPSVFVASRIEGIVIKNYGQGLFGKIVDPLFDKQVDESVHPIRSPYVRNRLSLSYVQ